MGWTNLGLTLVKLHNYKEAKEAAKQAVKLSPDFGPAWALLGNCYAKENRFADAVDALTRAARLNPKDPDIWRALSLSYAKLEDRTKAQEANAKVQTLTASASAPSDGRDPQTLPASMPADRDKYTELVTTTLRGFEEADVEALASKYADKVAYRDYGVVDHNFVRQDLGKYFERWPMTKTNLIGLVEVLNTSKPDEKTVRFRYEFRAASPDRKSFSTGTAWTVWAVSEGPEGLRIFGETQNVVRGKKR
jgi:tetratricopeptide (TPR) repeat protein